MGPIVPSDFTTIGLTVLAACVRLDHDPQSSARATRVATARTPPDSYDFGMAETADELRDQALALPTQDRARLASDLLASLDSDIVDIAEIDRLWSTETQRRAAMLESGGAGIVSWDEVEQRFAERRSHRHA